MLSKCKEFITNNTLFLPAQKIVLAVSGGVDSTVMVHLFAALKLNFSMAHCNFCLRKEDADKDQLFVENLAKKYGVKCHTISFDTNTYATENKQSIQMAARELRYNWFSALILQENYDYVAVATHLNDAIETFLLNATKGTGIAGLRGIKPENKKVIRPLLFATKQQIKAYATQNKIEFRQDKSNASVKYLRNKIRHQVVPVLKEINPSLEHSFLQNFANLTAVEQAYFEKVEQIKSQVITTKNKQTIIDLQEIKQLSFSQNYLYECIRSFGFSNSDCADIITVKISGKQFFSNKFRLLVNRQEIIIEQNNSIDNRLLPLKINKNTTIINAPITLLLEEVMLPKTCNCPKNIALLDAEKIEYPLELRLWENGDFFYPLGMPQKKKVSDFFIDNKLSILEKKKTYVLTSKGNIVWIINQRIDNRYKILSSTKKVLQITLPV